MPTSQFVVTHAADMSGNDISLSADGITWTEVTSALSNFLVSSAFGKRKFVAGSQGAPATDSLETSPDGSAWTLRSSPADTFDVNVLLYAGGKFVGILNSTGVYSIITSPDGITWTNHTIPSSGFTFNALAYSQSLHLYVAVGGDGTNGRVMHSPDAVTWTDVASALGQVWNCVTWGAGLFVALGGADVNIDPTTVHLMTSPDGATWTIQANPGDQVWSSVVYAAGKFVACGVANTIPDQFQRFMSSGDGISWTIFTQGFRRAWKSIAYGAGLYVAVAGDDDTGDPGSTAIATSPDGGTWTQRGTSITPTFCTSICVSAAATGNYQEGPGQGGNQAW